MTEKENVGHGVNIQMIEMFLTFLMLQEYSSLLKTAKSNLVKNKNLCFVYVLTVAMFHKANGIRVTLPVLSCN